MKVSKWNIRAEALKILLQMIPMGKVTTYTSLAKTLRTHPRVVGRLLANNENLIIIPCHRVIRSDGTIGGYKLGKEFKERLLSIEGVRIRGGKVVEEDIIDLFLELVGSENHEQCNND